MVRCIALSVVLLALVGCHAPFHKFHGPFDDHGVPETGYVEYDYDPAAAMPLAYPNPLAIRSPNHELLWEGLVDVVEDYFRVRREDRVRMVGNVVVEGRIETYPVTGATVLEPWRKDSVGKYNRWESTFQSIRRTAFVRVVPSGNACLVEVQVLKELEDLDRPERATSAAIPHKQSPDRKSAALSEPPLTLGWIGLGRDVELEQRILADMDAYFNAAR